MKLSAQSQSLIESAIKEAICQFAGNDEQTIVNWNTMFYSFFKYPLRNYSVEVILAILEEQGQEIFRSQPLGEIIFKDIFSKQTKINDAVLNKMFEISKDPQYLPTEAKDIFIF
jgi:hypothetical protein